MAVLRIHGRSPSLVNPMADTFRSFEEDVEQIAIVADDHVVC